MTRFYCCSTSSIKILLRQPVFIVAQTFSIQIVQNKILAKTVSALKQLRTGGFRALGEGGLGEANAGIKQSFLDAFTSYLVTKNCHGTSYANSEPHPKVSRKFSASVIKNQSFRYIVMPRLVTVSRRTVTLSSCVTNQSVTRFINSH